MARGKGCMKAVLRMLTKRGCVSYDELERAGIPRDVVHIYALRLERDGITSRLLDALDRKMALCIGYVDEGGSID
uniref:Uncharacterized protein n=1 Tax=Fervidicoccus fontis TaxID=683846 RepID=A0A7J3ZIE8_9CREN